MKNRKFLLVAMLLCVSGLAGASVPIIKLPDARRVVLNLHSSLALNNYLFGIKGDGSSAVNSADNGGHDMQTASVSRTAFSAFSSILWNAGKIPFLIDQRISKGSFSSNAREAFSSALYSAPFPDSGPLEAELHYGLIATSPAAPGWATLFLALGCVIYQGRQGRRRQNLFGSQKKSD